MKIPEPGDYVYVLAPDGFPWWGIVLNRGEDSATVCCEEPGGSNITLGEHVAVDVRRLMLDCHFRAPSQDVLPEFLGVPLAGASLDGLSQPTAVALVVEGMGSDGQVHQWRLRSADISMTHALGLHEWASARYKDKGT